MCRDSLHARYDPAEIKIPHVNGFKIDVEDDGNNCFWS